MIHALVAGVIQYSISIYRNGTLVTNTDMGSFKVTFDGSASDYREVSYTAIANLTGATDYVEIVFTHGSGSVNLQVIKGIMTVSRVRGTA